MSARETFSHPLLDPQSDYSLMRARLRTEGKMRGYFTFMVGREEWERYPRALASPFAEEERRKLARTLESVDGPGASGVEVLDVIRTDAWVLVVGLPEIHSPRPLPARVDLCLVREADQSPALGMLLPLSRRDLGEAWSVPDARRFGCRAFIFEPEAVARLEGFLGGRSFLHAFDPDVMASNLDAARALASVAELEGEWSPDADAIRFDRLGVPARHRLFPARDKSPVVVVAMHPDEPA